MRLRSLAAAVLLLSLLGSCNRGPENIEVEAIFRDVGDLATLSQVQASDVRIGTVTDIRLDGYNARVTMEIEKDVGLPKNAHAFIRQTSLLGERFVEILEPRSGKAVGELEDGAVIPLERTGIASTLDEVLAQLGAILESGGISDFAAFINSSAEIVRGREEKLGQAFAELRTLSGTLAGRAPEIGAAIDSFDAAFATFAAGSQTLKSGVSSSADASQILADQQQDLDRLIGSLDRFAAVSARYSTATTPASDRALKDIRRILDEVMKVTGDLDQSLTALARFTDLWPRVIPGDYVQLDVTVRDNNSPPPSGSSATATTGPTGAGRSSSLEELLVRPTR